MSDEETKELEAAREEIKKLHAVLWGRDARIDLLNKQLEHERAFSKQVGEENTRLRERVLGVVQRYGHNERCCSVEINPAAFYMLTTQEREEYLRHVVIDALDRLLCKVSGSAYLADLRRKVRG